MSAALWSGPRDLRSEFSWSRSRGAAFEECPRRYWFTYYGSWGGWEASAPPRVREAYILKQLQTRWMWVGDLVHRQIARALSSARAGELMPESRAVGEAMAAMRREFEESRSGAYRRRPKRAAGLFEHEYRVEVTDAEWGEAADHLRACLCAFYRSPFARTLPALPPGAWLPIEELATFELDGVKVYVKPDFAHREGARGARIIDWKTGRRDEPEDPIQLAGYALFALERGWAAAPEDVVTAEVNLARELVRERRMDAARLEGVKGTIRSSVAAMRALIDDPERNTAREERFAVTTDASVCARCSYLKICDESPMKRAKA